MKRRKTGSCTVVLSRKKTGNKTDRLVQERKELVPKHISLKVVRAVVVLDWNCGDGITYIIIHIKYRQKRMCNDDKK